MRRSLSLVVLVLVGLSPAHAGGDIRKKLTSVRDNIQVGEWSTNQAGIKVRHIPLRGGKQEGVHLLVVDNGMLTIVIVPQRGMGILSVTMGDLRLGWDSPVKEVVHPKFVNLQARGGLGWLDGFNEWLCRCGLENNGQPGKDEFINNVGDKATMDLTLHGKIANIPASEVEIDINGQTITVRGIVHERMLFGPKLELATEISTTAGATTFQIKDVVTNRGAQEEEFQLLYHANFGKPLLDEGAMFVAPLARVTPYNANAARDVKTFNHYRGPTPGYIEQVYLLQPRADKNDRTLIALKNQAGDRAASMAYSLKELPYLTLWKNTGAEADGYVTGLEPGTNYPNHRRVERQAGRVPKLAGGASRSFSIEYGLHSGQDAVRTLTHQIRQIQGAQPPAIDEQPQAKTQEKVESPEVLTVQEESLLRKIVYTRGIRLRPHKTSPPYGRELSMATEIIELHKKKRIGTLRLLLNILKGGKPVDALAAAGNAIALEKNPRWAAESVGYYDPDRFDVVVENQEKTYRARLIEWLEGVISQAEGEHKRGIHHQKE